jgi:hypothetical protein
MTVVDQSAPARQPVAPEAQSAVFGASGSEHWLREHLRAVVALAGTLRPSVLAGAIGRSLLDLPLAVNQTVLGHWQDQVADLARYLGTTPLPLRLLVNSGAKQPKVPTSTAQDIVPLHIEEDRVSFRGTGGVLRDLAGDYAPQDMIAVINGPQTLLRPLSEVLVRLAQPQAEVAIASYDDGTPGGIMLLRPSALGLIPEAGFVDLKEQALPQIAAHHRVAVVRWAVPAGLPIRTLGDYIQALRRRHQTPEAASERPAAFFEQWRTTFSIVEAGATVHPTANIHDSVVLAGGRVERDAVVAKCVVVPGGVVPAGMLTTDRVVQRPGARHAEVRV